MLEVITFPSGGRHPSINTYFFLAVRCNRSINILLKLHLAIAKKDQSTYSYRRGSSEARWWNAECVNTYLLGINISLSYVQIIIGHIISSYPDSSDGRAADLLSVGRGFKTSSKLKCEKVYFGGYM